MTRGRRWLLWASLASLALIGVLAAALVVLLGPAAGPAVDPVKDEAGLVVVRQRLAAAADDVNAVTAPPNSKVTRSARVSRCAFDSGEVFEPSLGREWRLTGVARSPQYDKVTDEGRQVGTAIAIALRANGWAGPAHLTGPDFPATNLTKSFEGHRVRLVIQVFDDSVLVSGYTPHRRVCRSHV